MGSIGISDTASVDSPCHPDESAQLSTPLGATLVEWLAGRRRRLPLLALFRFIGRRFAHKRSPAEK